MIAPIPIFMPWRKPDSCPRCARLEDEAARRSPRAEVCSHCGYEYPAEGGSAWESALIVLGTFVALWLLGTVLYWVASHDLTGLTLWEVIKAEWAFLRSLRVW